MSSATPARLTPSLAKTWVSYLAWCSSLARPASSSQPRRRAMTSSLGN
ncbi:Uncharacterised protein [Bordetella pertussis]|nr:Uncharacterised protein [Bordetella pertussis]